MTLEMHCPRCGSTNCEFQPKPHVHRCLDCGYDGHRPKGMLDRLRCGLEKDMRAQGIHVGLGEPPTCVCCGEPWPCSSAAPPTSIEEGEG
jgi:hypothetical protein